MKKFILIMFIILLIALQFPFYTIDGVTATVNIQIIMSIIRSGITSQDVGTLIIYGIPLFGIIISVVNLFMSKNLSIALAIIAAAGMLYCGYIYFFVSGVSGNINLGFILEVLIYLTILTMSIVSFRVKEF